MRPLALGAPIPGRELEWIQQALREVEDASYEDIAEVADAFSANAAFTETREVNVSAPTAANLAAVLATLLSDLKKRGSKNSG
jgi:hypothetical protein